MLFLAKYGGIVLSVVCIILMMIYDLTGIKDPNILFYINILMGGGAGHYFGTKTAPKS